MASAAGSSRPSGQADNSSSSQQAAASSAIATSSSPSTSTGTGTDTDTTFSSRAGGDLSINTRRLADIMEESTRYLRGVVVSQSRKLCQWAAAEGDDTAANASDVAARVRRGARRPRGAPGSIRRQVWGWLASLSFHDRAHVNAT